MASNPEKVPRPTGLEREKVVTAALELLNEVGFEGLTLRRLADKLGVKASALYWHFDNKQAIIDMLALRIIEGEFKNANPDDFAKATWQDLLLGMGRGMRNALRRHRDGAMVLANADLSQGNLSFKGRDLMMERMLELGFPGKLAFISLFSIGRYTLGCVFEEQADPRSRKTIDNIIADRRAEVAATSPALHKAMSSLSNDELVDADFFFEQGLATIIAGIDKRLNESK
jgi:TetR/AcrR family tetracycline transcriptional repressor